MILKIIRWILGYVSFSVDAQNAKILLNLISRNKLKIWDISTINDLMISKVLSSEFKSILHLSKVNNIKINLIDKKGFRFLCLKYRNRKGILIGLVLLFTLFKILSSYIWKVEICGDCEANYSQIMEASRKNGIFIGAKKKNIDSKVVNQNIMSMVHDISWISVNIQGCKASVLVKNRDEEPKFDSDTPNDIRSSCDALITRMETFSGTPLVKQGDAVLKGQILVSSLVVDANGNENSVHASANVWGEVYEEFEDYEDLCQDITIRTGNVKNVFKFKDFVLNFWNVYDYSYESEKYDNNIYIFGFSIPTGFSIEKRFETKEVSIYLTEEEAISNIQNRINKKIEEKKLEVMSKKEEKTIKKNRVYLKSKIRYLKNISTYGKI